MRYRVFKHQATGRSGFIKNFIKLFENNEFGQSSWVGFFLVWRKVLVQKLLRLDFALSQQQQPWVRRTCTHYANPVARRHTLFSYTHHSTCFAHFMWLKCDKRLASSVHLASCLCSLPHSPCHIPTSLSSPPAPTSPPSASSTSVARSRCQSTSAPARWRESGGLADSSPHTRMMRDPRAQGNLLQIHKSSLHAEGFLYFYRNGGGLQLMRRSQ